MARDGHSAEFLKYNKKINSEYKIQEHKNIKFRFDITESH